MKQISKWQDYNKHIIKSSLRLTQPTLNPLLSSCFYIIKVNMRNSYLRPLDFSHVGVNQKKYQTQQIPAKFLPEPDDYQKRQRIIREKSQADPSEINELLSPSQPLQLDQSPMPNIQKVQSMTFQSPLCEPPSEPHLAEATLKNPQLVPVTMQQRPSGQVFFRCCGDKPQEKQLCERCMDLLCGSCMNNPLRIKRCTRCIQRVCAECKRSLQIVFPDYKIRNYPITLKKVAQLHFHGCNCTLCSTKQ